MTDGGGTATRRNLAAERYREILDRRSADELRTLAHVKRFLERYAADPRFRDALGQRPEALHLVAEGYELRIDLRQALPLFRTDHMRFRFCEEEASWPLAKAWDDYQSEMAECRTLYEQAGDCPGVNPRLHAWRQRQIRRARGELGATGSVITHPILAFELSAGCSVGCWFCGIQLVTPTRCSERWPLGYRVFDERRFDTGPQFRAAIEELIDAHMPEEIASVDVVGFRDDLTYHRKPDGFELRAGNGHFALGGFPAAGELGDMIHKGDMSAGEI